MTKTLEDRLNTLDVGLLEQIESQTSADDKRSLLALHAASRDAFGGFTYLEIGSYLGGSLQSFIADPMCRGIISIDRRPPVVVDERLAEGVRYPHNSTERMLTLLGQVSNADLTKLRTIEDSVADIPPSEISPAPRLCFIDGEHTNSAALSDAEFCRSVLHLPGLIAFHDSSTVSLAISRFLSGGGGIAYTMRGGIFVVEFGGDRIFHHPLVRCMVPNALGWRLANRIGVANLVAARPVERMRRRIRLRTRLRGMRN